MEPYVGVYERKLDDRHRLQLPAGFEIEQGERLYIEKQENGQLRCYDSMRFKELSKEFGRENERFKNYMRVRVEHSSRICLNGEYGLPHLVVVEGKGDHFTVRPGEQRPAAHVFSGLLRLVHLGKNRVE